jgi:aspartyl-tRNA(Asn)/glutamyl-tRNA(Gln) amidotransferase subunit B
MEEGSLRCDANISIRPAGSETLGAKVEIKNMNSFRSVEHALAFEASRQREALALGGTIAQETRLWDEEAGRTESMRGKEGAHDYRYFPEPDLLAFTMDDARLDRIRARLPELPGTKRLRYVQTLGLTDYDAGVLTADRPVAEYFEAVIAAGVPPKTASNWITTELLGALHARKTGIGDSRIAPAGLAALLRLIESGTISGKIAKTVFAAMLESGKDPGQIVKERGLIQITDEDALAGTVREVLAANPQSVADFKSGKQQAVGFLVGQVMKATGGKANPQSVNKLLREELAK